MKIKDKHRKPLLLIVLNSFPFFLSHRLPIARAAIDNGFDVHVATADKIGIECMQQYGITHHTISLTRSGQNPFTEKSCSTGENNFINCINYCFFVNSDWFKSRQKPFRTYTFIY